jgi:flagellar basal body-associated protein FliL
MRRNFFLVLFIIVMIGIQPVLAQSGSEAAEEAAKEEGTVININLVSDSEFTEALQNASDVELINEIAEN